MKDFILNNKYKIFIIIVLVSIWFLFATYISNEIKIPSPIRVIEELIVIVLDKNFLLNLVSTCKRVIFSFLLSFTLGIVLGMISGFYGFIRDLLEPIILVLKSMPTMAVILLALIWLGRESSPILVCFLVCFPIIYSTVVSGIINIDKKLLEMVNIYRFTKMKKLFHLYLPSIVASLAAILPTGFSLTFKVCIAAEVLSQPKYAMGTGFQMERVALNTAGVLAWAIITIILSGVFETIISKILKISFISNKQ
ncbi:MAG: ABC transporter permease [Lachnospirales bacterium]